MSATITQDGGLRLPSGGLVRFERPVLEATEVEDVTVVVLDPGCEQSVSRNVYGVANDGGIRWQIAPYDFPHGPTPYTGVYVQDGVLFAYNRCGAECRIDAKTGNILSTELIK